VGPRPEGVDAPVRAVPRLGVNSRLASTLLHLVNIESVSRNERAITDWIAQEAARLGLPIAARGDAWLVFGPRRRGRDLVILAGHSDTIPVQDNLPGHVEADVVYGLGASDMKASLAVMLELGRWLAGDGLGPGGLDVQFLVFGHEELSLADSLLPYVFHACPDLLEARLAVMMEPTANQLHAGCLGNISARLEFEGVAAHSARPWLGRNAIHDAVRGLQRVTSAAVEEVEIDGLRFREVVSVTMIQGGVANNVIPDHVTCQLNYRYAATRTSAEAEVRLRELVGADGRLTIVSNAPAAPVALANPLLARLREVGGMSVAPKQAWTPVAEFAQAGLDAVNYGPGDPDFAHRRDERASVSAMAESLDVLKRWVGTA
jgi:succinyl-diaminopimelate desuccinylase